MKKYEKIIAFIVSLLIILISGCTLSASEQNSANNLNQVVKVHYHRYNNQYAGWGLHVWGSAIQTPTEWDFPLLFTEQDSFGKYANISIQNDTGTISFLIHNAGEKDIIVERTFTNLQKAKEFWLKEGVAEIFTTEPSINPEFLYSKFTSEQTIVATLDQNTKVAMSDICLKNQNNDTVLIKSISQTDNEVTITLSKPQQLETKNYKIEYGSTSKWVYLSDELLNGKFANASATLGAKLTATGATLNLWSPPATKIVVNIFDKNNQQKIIGSKNLDYYSHGIWTTTITASDFGISSLDKYFYQYQVTAYGTTLPALDPYAFSMAAFDPNGSDTVGKAAFVDLHSINATALPQDDFRNSDIMKNSTDLIAYEIHVRDFTSDPNSLVPKELRGTYPGFEHKIPYLRDLGITHVQFLPIQNYVSVNEVDREFRDGSSANFNYNWGYDPHNYFTPEGWLSTNANNPYTRISEFKHLVQELHKNDIGVIVDVVYNHTYNSNVFDNVCPNCYYRTDNIGRVSTTTGAGPTVESRRIMVRKLIIDSLKHFVDVYHVNGFRFDLMGFLDTNTMLEIRSALGNDIILHGEAWELTDLPGNATTKTNLPHNANIGAFSDTTRDSIGGAMSNKGFVQGYFDNNSKVRSAIIGNIMQYQTDYNNNGTPDTRISTDNYDRFAASPLENLGFLTVHDGYTLWDKINLSYKGTWQERSTIAKLAYNVLFTTQGRLILHGGDEFARTKPLAAFDPSSQRAHTSDLVTADPDLPDVLSFHENSYKSSDFTNMVRWNRLNDIGRDLFLHTKSLINMRRSTPWFRMNSAAQINTSLKFVGEKEILPLPNDNVAGYKTFADVPNLTLKFTGGPANKNLYIVGEVYAGADKNPVEPLFVLNFNAVGMANITFSAEQIKNFDLKAWSDANNVQIKLVNEPGKWDSPEGAYSPMGNNTIKPTFIDKNNSLTISLSTIDCTPGEIKIPDNAFIAYQIDTNLPASLSNMYSKIIVAHNASASETTIEVPSLSNSGTWRVIFDDSGYNYHGINNSPVVIQKNKITLKPHSSAIIAKLLSNP